jgi:uncharacterized DUF497 family protein
VRFEWDESKNRSNRAKHGVGFETARLVFDDPRALSLQDRFEDGEERWQTLGRVGPTLILLVAHTFRNGDRDEDMIRIISARKATLRERTVYEQDDR